MGLESASTAQLRKISGEANIPTLAEAQIYQFRNSFYATFR